MQCCPIWFLLFFIFFGLGWVSLFPHLLLFNKTGKRKCKSQHGSISHSFFCSIFFCQYFSSFSLKHPEGDEIRNGGEEEANEQR